MSNISRLDKVKSVIRDRYVDATLGLYFTRNWTGDQTFTIWEEDGVTIDICHYYEYFEVFGLTEKEENELLAFYNSLNENMKKVEEHRLCANKLLSRLWKKDKKEDIEVMEYPQVDGITPTLMTTKVSEDMDYCNNCPYISHNDDCISREYLEEQYWQTLIPKEMINTDVELGINIGIRKMYEVIKNAPSVIPKQVTGKLESVEISTSEGEESTMSQQ